MCRYLVVLVLAIVPIFAKESFRIINLKDYDLTERNYSPKGQVENSKLRDIPGDLFCYEYLGWQIEISKQIKSLLSEIDEMEPNPQDNNVVRDRKLKALDEKVLLLNKLHHGKTISLPGLRFLSLEENWKFSPKAMAMVKKEIKSMKKDSSLSWVFMLGDDPSKNFVLQFLLATKLASCEDCKVKSDKLKYEVEINSTSSKHYGYLLENANISDFNIKRNMISPVGKELNFNCDYSSFEFQISSNSMESKFGVKIELWPKQEEEFGLDFQKNDIVLVEGKIMNYTRSGRGLGWGGSSYTIHIEPTKIQKLVRFDSK